MNNQKFYDIVDTVVSENEENHSLVSEADKLEMADEIEELFESEDYTSKDLKSHVETNLKTDVEIISENSGLDENTIEKYIKAGKEEGWDTKFINEHAEDIQLYEMEREEFIMMLVEDLQIIGEIPEKALRYIDTDHVWNSEVRFDFSETKYGFLYTSI